MPIINIDMYNRFNMKSNIKLNVIFNGVINIKLALNIKH